VDGYPEFDPQATEWDLLTISEANGRLEWELRLADEEIQSLQGHGETPPLLSAIQRRNLLEARLERSRQSAAVAKKWCEAIIASHEPEEDQHA
jgi:hypothetical protein